MQKILISMFLSFFIIGCQLNRTNHKQLDERSIASEAPKEVWKLFIKNFSSKTKISKEEVERRMMKYFQGKSSTGVANHNLLGITDDQVHRIKSLSDDLPYMPKVRKFGIENMDKIFPSVSRSKISSLYQKHYVGKRGIPNRYNYRTSPLTRSLKNRKDKLSQVMSSINEKDRYLIDYIKSIKNVELERSLRSNLAIMKRRGANSPAIAANGHEIIESATIISQKTGLKGIGNGCEEFSKNASLEILEIKANVDRVRAKIVELWATKKNNGRMFASSNDIKANLRLTQKELDQATEKAFVKVMGYSDDQARLAVRRLKGKPCRLY